MKNEDCLFCKIAAGEIPSTKVYEDDYTYAFEDLNPMMPVHTLVVPKNHYDNIADNITDEDMAHLMHSAAEVAKIKGINESGFRLVINTNDDACQTVHHVHVHVLGGEKMNDGDPKVSK